MAKGVRLLTGLTQVRPLEGMLVDWAEVAWAVGQVGGVWGEALCSRDKGMLCPWEEKKRMNN